MSRHFQPNKNEMQILPTKGACPSCKRETDWITLIKDLSLRASDPALVAKLLNPSKRAANGQPSYDSESSDDNDDGQSEDDWIYQQFHSGLASMLLNESASFFFHLKRDQVSVGIYSPALDQISGNCSSS